MPPSLVKLGQLSAKALADDGPLKEEERKALRLRVTMARAELKRAKGDELSPRVSIQALVEALSGVPEQAGSYRHAPGTGSAALERQVIDSLRRPM